MRSLDHLRSRLLELGPDAEQLLPTLMELELELELRARRIAALTSAGHITTTLAGSDGGDAATVGQNLLMAACALIDSDGAALALVDERAEAGLEVVACDGCERVGDCAPRRRSECSLALRARGAMAAALAGGEQAGHPGLRENDDGVLVASFRSSVALPLELRGTPMGALYLERQGPTSAFAAADRETLRLFARQAGLALGLTVGVRRAVGAGD